MPIPLKEMEADLAATEKDINSLKRICNGLNAFMTYTGGEDRSAFRMDLFKYAGLEAQAQRLKQRIQSAIDAIK